MKTLLLLFLLCTSLAHAAEDLYDGPPPPDTYDGPPPKGYKKPEQSKWIYVYAGITKWEWDVARAVNIAGAREDNPTLSAQKAKERCEDPVNWPDLHCREIYKTNSSCVYYLAGLNDWGTGSWGIGSTPQEAYDNCNSKGGDCERNPIKGGCADGSKPDWQPIVHNPVKSYRVIVAGFSRTADGASHVAAAEAAGPTYEYALASAKKSCHVHHQLVPECKEVLRYEHGCNSIAIGIDNRPNVLKTYWTLGNGSTKKESDAKALKACQALNPHVECDPTQISGACSY